MENVMVYGMCYFFLHNNIFYSFTEAVNVLDMMGAYNSILAIATTQFQKTVDIVLEGTQFISHVILILVARAEWEKIFYDLLCGEFKQKRKKNNSRYIR